jgi:pimeloyl-ACP methyl ester carboxylesterase
VSLGVFSKKSMAEMPEVTALFERLFEEQATESYTRIIDVLLAADLSAVVPTVSVPCAVLGGAEDSYAPPDALRAFAASLTALPAPCPVTVIEGAGHMAFYEAPEAFAHAVKTALAKSIA